MSWTLADETLPYRCFELRRFVHVVGGYEVGPAWVEQTYGGGHSATSAHYPANGARAADFGEAGVDHPAIARWLAQWAQGPSYVIEELFCADIGLAYSHGAVSSFHDNPAHTHAAIRPGAALPWPITQGEDDMGAYSGEAIRPGETIPFRILPPGGGASGGGYSDPIYFSIPFDSLGKPDGRFRWAIVDDKGKWIDGNGDGGPIKTPGIIAVAHPGAYQLTITNMEPAGGRIIGPPTFEWARP